MRGRSVRDQLSAKKIPDQRDHFVSLVLEREVSRVDKVQLGLRQIAQIGRRAVGGKDLVVLAPDNQRGRLALAKERLELRIEGTLVP